MFGVLHLVLVHVLTIVLFYLDLVSGRLTEYAYYGSFSYDGKKYRKSTTSLHMVFTLYICEINGRMKKYYLGMNTFIMIFVNVYNLIQRRHSSED